MNSITRTFSFVTPAFAHGAYQSQHANYPELRAPSVKGQLHWWYSALFGQGKSDPTKDELEIFGRVANREAKSVGLRGNQASLVVVRIIEDDVVQMTAAMLPHKRREGRHGPKQAIAPGSRFSLQILPRREGPDEQQWQKLERATDSWLLLGGIGQRANRAAGSLWPEGAPETQRDYELRAAELLEGSAIRFAVLAGSWEDEDRLRSDVSDILSDQAMAHCGRPFGTAGDRRERVDRKPSPLKLRAVQLDGNLRLVATWDTRDRRADLREGVRILAEVPKPLAGLLEPALDRLLA